MNKIKHSFKISFKLSIRDISLSGIFVGLWIVVNRFLTIDFGIMKAGITYAIAIAVGLCFKPLISIFIAVIADTISISISDTGIGFWMWQYALLYPGIVLLVGFMKWIFTTKNKKLWMTFSIASFLITILGAVLIALLNKNFIHKSSQGVNSFDFTSSWSKILIWVMIGLMFLSYLVMMLVYFKKRTNNMKILIMIYTIVSMVIVLFIWVWGPYADIMFLRKFYGNTISFETMYYPFSIVRILKTPVILPLYTFIVYALYKVCNTFTNTKNKWK